MHHNKQRYSDSYCKSTSFSRFTSYSYNSTVLFYHCLYVEKPQPAATFGGVDISCRNPVEFISRGCLSVGIPIPWSVTEISACSVSFFRQRIIYVGFIRRVFDGIIYQVTRSEYY